MKPFPVGDTTERIRNLQRQIRLNYAAPKPK
jgi:hypothetical protein